MAIMSPSTWIIERIGRVAPTPEPMAVDPTVTPRLRVLHWHDLTDALALGWRDFAHTRADVMFLCAFYPAVGLVFARLASGGALIPMLFPLASGFALLGPLAALGLVELSRRRERGLPVRWSDVFAVLRAPALFDIAIMAALLVGIFLLWLVAAMLVYGSTLAGTDAPTIRAFADQVLHTPAGHRMIAIGMATGFGFAVLVLAIGFVTFPMLLDRGCSLNAAIATSLRVVAKNPAMAATWGLVVAATLAVASIPLFLGLVVALPWLGHATWHLYRKAVRWPYGM